MNLVEKITKSQIRTDIPEFRVGDTVSVGTKLKKVNVKEFKITKESLLQLKVLVFQKTLLLDAKVVE